MRLFVVRSLWVVVLLAACQGSAVPSTASRAAALPKPEPTRPELERSAPPDLAGRVVGAGGEPLEGALVRATADDLRTATTTAAADGRFAFRDLQGGADYEVSATRPDRGAASLSVVAGGPGSETLTLTLPSEGLMPIAGRVLDESGRAAPDGDVVIVQRGGSEQYSIPITQGRFGVSLARGSYYAFGKLEGRDLAVVGIEPETSAMVELGPVPKDVVAWIRENAVAVAADASGACDGARPLLALVGAAPVVGIGEATHGTHEFAAARAEVVKCLTELGEPPILAIEAPAAEGLALDEYVRGGPGEPRKLVAALMFWTAATEELVELVEWMRAANARRGAREKVRIAAIDIQHGATAGAWLARFVERHRGLAAAHLEALGWLADPFHDERLGKIGPDRRAALAASVRGVEAALKGKGPRRGSAREEWRRARWMARLLARHMAVATSPSRSNARDAAMAANVMDLLADAGGGKVLVWAHNTHLSKKEAYDSYAPMGMNLAKDLGERYVAVAQLFGEGRFRAVDGTADLLSTFEVGAPPLGGLDEALARLTLPRVALDLRKVPSAGSVAAWFRRPQVAREAGAFFNAPRDPMYAGRRVFPEAFDVILYHGVSTPARTLQAPERQRVPAIVPAPRNGDFERAQLEGWFADARQALFDYEVSLSPEAHQGKHALRIAREPGSRGGRTYGSAVQRVDATPWQGRDVTVTAWVRPQLEPGSVARIWAEDARTFVESVMGESGDWQQVSVTFHVPSEATTLDAGLGLVGDGELLVDDVVFSVK